MVNSEEFSLRLQKILEYYDISAATFADAIDVGRSSISHILSGRNKPSLDFVLKIVQAYPDVELYWLLNGKGNFPSKGNSSVPPEKDHRASPSIPTPSAIPEKTTVDKENGSGLTSLEKSDKGKIIQKIVIFYTDGTFDAFEN